MEVEEQLQIVTEQIASSDRGSDMIETMEEIRQLERVTVAAKTRPSTFTHYKTLIKRILAYGIGETRILRSHGRGECFSMLMNLG